MERKYPQAIAYSFDEVLPRPSETALKFLLNDKDEKCPKGWKIFPVSDSQVRDYKIIYLCLVYFSFAA